jgi:hypothetical protein
MVAIGKDYVAVLSTNERGPVERRTDEVRTGSGSSRGDDAGRLRLMGRLCPRIKPIDGSFGSAIRASYSAGSP